MTDPEKILPVELGWIPQPNTGWGLFALHLALGLARQGRRVHLPLADTTGFPATLRPGLDQMMAPSDHAERRIRFDTWGNHRPAFQPVPNRYRVLLAVFEDTTAIDRATMLQYDLILAPSRWIQDMLLAQGIPSTLWHQGVNESVFCPAPTKTRSDGKFLVFSGGKLEFRKGQDIVVEAFKRFRETPEGKDAILVTAWQNPWPQTMEGIWESGYVRGVPVMRGGSLDIAAWLEANGIPRSASIDVGFLSQPQMADVMRECDVGLFPNRAEGATNMALCEALGVGLPCIVSSGTGHADVIDAVTSVPLAGEPCTLPCALYKGMAGWREVAPSACLHWLQKVANDRAWRDRTFQPVARQAREVFGWSTRTAVLHDLLTETSE